MAPNRRLKRVVASQPGFLKLKSSKGAAGSDVHRKKRLNKNKKKSWNKYSDINDVDEFLEDIRHQERTTGGLLSEKSDESLFFLDVRPKIPQLAAVEPVEEKTGRRKTARPLRIDLILQLDSKVPPPKDVLAYQRPNAKKLRRIAQKAEQLTAKGVVTRRQKRLMVRPKLDDTAKKAELEPNNNPERDYYDIWKQEPTSTADPWFLEQTGKMRVKRPDRLNEKPSLLPAVEVISAGGSYNPDFFSHQALLQVAHEVEVKKQKEADKLVKRLAVKKENFATEETIMTEQVEGLVEEEDEDNANEGEEEEDESAGGNLVAVKKTEKQRRKARAEILKAQRRRAQRIQSDNQQQLFQLRSIKTSIKQQEEDTKTKQTQRKSNQEAQKSQPRRLGKLKFEPQDMEVQLSDELAGSLRQLKPEGSVLKDRFKSLQKRNLIEPRDRAKFKRRLKVKYQEKRAFRAIT